jgi:hypothetical protein
MTSGVQEHVGKRILINFSERYSLFFIRCTAIYLLWHGTQFVSYSEFKFEIFIGALAVLSYCWCYIVYDYVRNAILSAMQFCYALAPDLLARAYSFRSGSLTSRPGPFYQILHLHA